MSLLRKLQHFLRLRRSTSTVHARSVHDVQRTGAEDSVQSISNASQPLGRPDAEVDVSPGADSTGSSSPATPTEAAPVVPPCQPVVVNGVQQYTLPVIIEANRWRGPARYTRYKIPPGYRLVTPHIYLRYGTWYTSYRGTVRPHKSKLQAFQFCYHLAFHGGVFLEWRGV